MDKLRIGLAAVGDSNQQDMDMHSDARLVERLTKELDQKDALLYKIESDIRAMVQHPVVMSDKLDVVHELTRLMQQDIDVRQAYVQS